MPIPTNAIVSILSMLMMAIIPIGTIVSLQKVLEWKFRWVAAGAASFVSSQVVHLPLNYVLAKLGILSSASPIGRQSALVLGLTAGICEELARVIVLTRWIPEVVREERRGILAFGLGHSGIEAVIVGVFGVLQVIQLLALQNTEDWGALGIPSEQLETVREQVETFASQPDWMSLVGLGERAMAVLNHLFMTSLVVKGVASKNSLWILSSIIWHTSLNTLAVLLHQHHSVLAAEGYLAVMTALAIITLWRWRMADANALKTVKIY